MLSFRLHLASAGLVTVALPAGAQLPGLPVLQNAFANPGITAGLNYGRGTDVTGYAAAAAWAPGSARFVISGGIGATKPDGGKSSTAYGGRVAVPVMRLMDGAAGLGAFAGYGGWEIANTSVAVLGVSAGYRRPLGSLGVSVHTAPSYQRFRSSVADKSVSNGVFRYSAGLDVSFGERFGATIGFEGGGTGGKDAAGPGGSTFGLGVSYALRRVQ
jgi:hypothetical protein